MVAAAVWLAEQGALIGWGDAKDGKAVNRRWKSDATDDPALVPALLHGSRNSIIVPKGRLVITDIDKHGWYEQLVSAGLPDTFTVESPTVREVPGQPDLTFRGRHVYALAPLGYDVLTIPGVWKGGETRRSVAGEQSMVLGPWSMRPDGVYTPAPGTPRHISEAPAEVFDFIIANAARSGPLITVAGGDDDVWEWDGETMGSRHDHLRDKIRAWRGLDDSADSLKARTVRYIDKHHIPLERPGGEEITDAEIDRMITGALKKYDDDLLSGGVIIHLRGDEAQPAQPSDDFVIDPLAIESRIDSPAPLDFHALPTPLGLAMLLDHLNPLTDAPHSSLALASMVVFSALVGPSPSLDWRGRHRCALFGCLVGHSGVGRKGATMREVERAFLQVDPLLSEIQTGGMASGEVLVDILNESKTNTLGTTLIWEHEIASVLTIAAREGNIMSSNLRKAWDGDRVESRSRAKNKSFAVGYNVAFLGGVTPHELARKLSPDDIANGWANRFLWFHSEKRAGGYGATRPDGVLNGQAVDYLRHCIDFARHLGGSSMLIKPAFTMTLSHEANARLEELAELLDVPPVGSIGALRQRMPAHVIRLAMVSALLDAESVVSLDHIAFGEALAGYAVDSMRSVFGMRIDDPLAMLVAEVLTQAPGHWLNTTDLRRATGGKDHSRLMSALRILIDAGFVVREDRVPSGGKGGRTSVGYRLLGV